MEILENLKMHSDKFQSMSDKYDNNQRQNSRLLTLDELFANKLFQRLKPMIEKHIINVCPFEIMPLGFNVLKSDWKLDSINHAIRFNKYNDKQFFKPHIDAQYCPSGFSLFFFW